MGIPDKTIFVDVDDTLIIYEEYGIHHFGAVYGEPYRPNYKLIEKLKTFIGNIVIWSGGGSQYARLIAKEVLPKEVKYTVKSKFNDFADIKAGDLIIDDQKEAFIAMKDLGISIFGPLEDWGI